MDTSLDIQPLKTCPLTEKLLETIESPVEVARKEHQKKLIRKLHEIEKDMEITLFKIRLSELPLQKRILFKLKTELIHKLDSVLMPESRKSYLLHQLSNVRDVDELASLIHETNHRQITQESIILSNEINTSELGNKIQNSRQQLLKISLTPQGVAITTEEFNLLAGIFIENRNETDLMLLREISTKESFQLLNHELEINESLEEALRPVSLSDSTIAILGTTDPMMSIVTDLMMNKAKKLILFHHSPLEASLKLQRTIYKLIQRILKSEEITPLTAVIRKHWKEDVHVVNFLDLPAIQSVLKTTTDLREISEADISICGNCPTIGFLTNSHFRSGARIIDMSPDSSLGQVVTERSDLQYHKIFKFKNRLLN